ncbi:hypothetical protein A2574_01815 [Candidatus Shapirobacteria bacterium RIFOXYD1_FULL_38_32]|uniref:Uncharacterized protein n=4 Tax=Patescibacteria group TaxID=1783273 RepID=A0A0G0JYV5_9BACT|nr:MAG: hypothetical protein US90_C0001G0017 [Candidatus Shapirobacteria bacterium GW2011_GWE2_38_30]KKQ91965.1 MAG: hypothetical protein UT14_C0007G0007 [Candidatus Shapirobacteria bacterium GW2011_GWE1_38_92]OGJ06049.1 MAG: hypothetical protein A2192_02615 [Candidatus Nomurabacteria bacterium RIFOXYA1_FULL_35_17]OGL56045.1 MAG: hypothetical protein A2410_02510 [Candidatus Shapirobacteria bacterium RIFOXYC1_FULL_38_24]OGL57005.1 MAG: hypothetical protein A2367_00740 [Candidatus Shapirobacteria
MENTELLSKLKAEYKQLFQNVWEFGGGYGFRLNHGIRVMSYCQKIAKFTYHRPLNRKMLKLGNKHQQVRTMLGHQVGRIEL